MGAVAATAREAKQRAAQSKTVERAREAADRVREEAGGGIQHIQAVLPTLQGDDDDQYDEESEQRNIEEMSALQEMSRQVRTNSDTFSSPCQPICRGFLTINIETLTGRSRRGWLT